jgi:hypothetical protein
MLRQLFQMEKVPTKSQIEQVLLTILDLIVHLPLAQMDLLYYEFSRKSKGELERTG